MSMEIYVLSDRRLASIAEWQRAIDRKGFPLRLSTPTPFARLNGAVPVVLRDRMSAFECDHRNADVLMAETPNVSFGQRWRYALAFRWGADIDAGVSAYLAAAAYAAATAGRILDAAAGKLISPDSAEKIAGELEQGRPLIEEAVRRALERLRRP
jgi:hypothetical protein